ncbi:MAG: peroxiredoxin family protein [Tepidisphaeraceae bacterium]
MPSDSVHVQIGSTAPPITLPDQTGEMTTVPVGAPRGPTVLVFIRGHWCPYCRRYLSKLRAAFGRIAQRGATLVVVSAEPIDTSAALHRELGLPFPILSDVAGTVIDTYGVRNLLLDVGTHLPHPSVFIIDSAGVVRFRSVDRNYKKRTTIRTILKALDEVSVMM